MTLPDDCVLPVDCLCSLHMIFGSTQASICAKSDSVYNKEIV